MNPWITIGLQVHGLLRSYQQMRATPYGSRRAGHERRALGQVSYCSGYRGPGAVATDDCPRALDSLAYYSQRHGALTTQIARALSGQVIALGRSPVPHARPYWLPERIEGLGPFRASWWPSRENAVLAQRYIGGSR